MTSKVSTTLLLDSLDLKAQRQTLGEKLWETIPDGLAGGFVLDRGGEGGVCFVLKQEGQSRLCRICSKTSSQFKATIFFSVGSNRKLSGNGSATFTLAPVLQQVLVWYREVASLESPSLAIGSLSWVQLPGRRIGSLIVPHGTETKSQPFVVILTLLRNCKVQYIKQQQTVQRN